MSNGAKFNRKSKISLKSKSANLTGHLSEKKVGQKLPYGANKLRIFYKKTLDFQISSR